MVLDGIAGYRCGKLPAEVYSFNLHLLLIYSSPVRFPQKLSEDVSENEKPVRVRAGVPAFPLSLPVCYVGLGVKKEVLT